MAKDIVPMDDKEFVCPHCGKKVLLKWQLAIYEGGDSPQFIGLEKAEEDVEMKPRHLEWA